MHFKYFFFGLGIIPYLITSAVNYIISIDILRRLKTRVDSFTLSMPKKFAHSMKVIFQSAIAEPEPVEMEPVI